MAYKPKSKRTNSPVGPQGKKILDGLTANKNIDDIRALSKISNTQSTSISNLDTEINSANQRISQISTSKQDKLTLTTVGTSGPATLNNNNLNVPNYSTGLTVGSTPIAGGAVGRLLFEGTGNVLQESSNLFWNSTNNRLGIGTSTPAYSIENFIPNVFGGSNVGLFISDFNLSFSGSSSWLAWGRSNTQLGQSSGIRALWLGNNGFEQGIAFHTASGGNGALSNISGSEAMRITNTKNLLINTTTDAGYKTDINGTLRLQSSLILLNPSFTQGGSITHSANSTLSIVGGPASESIVIGPSNRIFINAQQSRFPNGSVQIGWTLTLGSTNATGNNMLLMQGSITAASALGRGIGMDTTLVAAANNDVLIGVDINPTFTNGAFTGVTNIAARIGGHLAFSAGGDRYIYQQSPATSGSGSNLIIQSASANTSGQGGNIYIYPGSGAGGPGPGKTFIGNQNGWDGIYMTGLVTIGNGGPNTGSALQVNAGGQNGLNIYWDNLTPFMQYGLVSGRQARFVNSSSYTFSSKVFINTTVDAGFNFDVNGTARVLGRLTLGNAGTAGELYSNPSVGMNFASGQVTDVFTFTQMNSGRFSTQGPVEQSMLRLGIGQATSAGGNSLGSVIRMIGDVTNSSLTSVYNNIQTNTVINTSGGTTTYRGFYHNPTLTATVGVTHYAFHSTSGAVVINSVSPNASSVLQADSTTQGFLPPRMTNAQMLAIATPSEGLVVYDTTNRKLCCYDGGTWQNLF